MQRRKMVWMIRRLVILAGMLYLCTVLTIVAFAALLPMGPPADGAKSDVIVVLGAGMDGDGTLHRSSTLRVERGVELWKAGVAPRMHFTGGVARPDGPSAGEQMANLAISLGVPAEATSFEGQSLSTLQNALFSQPMLKDARHLTLVTEGFHLPRAWLTFTWAGGHQLDLAVSERFRAVSPNSRLPQVSMVVREALAVWFNLARALLWHLGGAVGVADERRNTWLA
jgi:uncharacterized SAM-binding protein YcdF (DUF218 family)